MFTTVCEDQFLRDFLGWCVTKISIAREGIKPKVIPYDEILKKPVARRWLPENPMYEDKFVQSLYL